MGFDFSSEERRELGYRLIDRIDQYFSSLNNRAVQPPASQRTVAREPQPLPELGSDATQILDDLCTEMIDRGFHIPAANYFGLMNPTPTYMAVLADALVSALNPQLASLARSQFASALEAETIGWIASRFGWHKTTGNAPPPSSVILCDGTFTSGGNEANFTALALAISHHFPNAIEDGIATIGARPVFYASAESHHSLEKSAGLLGLGRKAMRRIPVNDRLRLDTARLILQIEADYACGFLPFCIVATAGTTSSGAIDDLNALASIAERYGLWLHVDGAYGAAAAFSDKYRSLLSGIERADSITVDPHKWLSMPFAAGIILTRHPAMLERTFAVASPYMPHVARPSMIDNFKVSAQWSRRMNSLKLWLTLRVHGRQAYEEMIERQMQLASEMCVWFEDSEYFALAAPQVLPILNFRLRGVDEAVAEAAHQAFIEEFNRDGSYWIEIVEDPSISHPEGCESLLGLAEQVLSTEGLSSNSTLTILVIGNKATANEPWRLGRFPIPKTRTVLEGRTANVRRQQEVLRDIRNKCQTIHRTTISPIFIGVTQAIADLRAQGCNETSGCQVLVDTDLEENVDASIKKSLNSPVDEKLILPPPIKNDGIHLVFCGLAVTTGRMVDSSSRGFHASPSRSPVREDRLREIWQPLFAQPEAVSFEPYCPTPMGMKSQIGPGTLQQPFIGWMDSQKS